MFRTQTVKNFKLYNILARNDLHNVNLNPNEVSVHFNIGKFGDLKTHAILSPRQFMLFHWTAWKFQRKEISSKGSYAKYSRY